MLKRASRLVCLAMATSVSAALVSRGDECESDDDGAWDAWEEEGGSPCIDIFSNHTEISPPALIAYMADVHGFDLRMVYHKHGLSFFEKMKLVNYLRRAVEAHGAAAVLENLRAVPTELPTVFKAQMESEELLKPVVEDDPLLMYDLDEEDEEDHQGEQGMATAAPVDEAHLREALADAHKQIEYLRDELGRRTQRLEEVMLESEQPTANRASSSDEDSSSDDAPPKMGNGRGGRGGQPSEAATAASRQDEDEDSDDPPPALGSPIASARMAGRGGRGSSGGRGQATLKKKGEQPTGRGISQQPKIGGTEALVRELQHYYRNSGLTEEQVQQRVTQALVL